MNYDELLAPAAKAMRPSGIRKFFDLAADMPHCISLGVGEPDFKTPWSVRDAGIRSLELGRTKYTANSGLKELRGEICNYLQRRFDLHYKEENILVTVGGSEAIDLTIRAVVQPGDEVIIPEPCFVCYYPITTLTGGVPVPLPLKAENGFKLTAQELEAAITPRTKLIIFPFPCNPTGAVMRREDLEPIAALLRDKDIIVLSDEIYAELTYGGERHVSIASLPGMKERTVVVNGFSKAYAMTGWRLGYACGPEPIIKVMTKIHQSAIMCAPTTSQYAAVTALRRCDADIEAMRSEYDMRRRFLVSSLNRMGLDCFEPEGAFYAFPSIRKTGLSSEDFCEKLLFGKKVAVVPGNAFGDSGEGHVRISYSYSIGHLSEALHRIELFLQELGALVFAWMSMTGNENPFYEHFDEICEICAEHDVTISLGDACRPGCLADATDVCQIEELVRLGELTKRAWAHNVQVMVEGPGHVPLNQVAANMEVQKSICMGAPFYVLGPLVTDIAPGYDHITAAIGGAVAAMSGAAFLCYVTPAEHLALPNVEDVKQGIVASKIAAHAADIAKGIPHARDIDDKMGDARRVLDWDAQFACALDPETAKAIRDARLPEDDHSDTCSMCGKFCAVRSMNKALAGEYIDIL